MLNKKVLFIGGGNMAEGIIRGQINTGAIACQNIYVYEILEKRAKYLNDTYNIKTVPELIPALNEVDIIFIAVRPQDALGVLKQVKEHITKQLVISICAGITIELIEKGLSQSTKIARVMPNVLIEAQAGYSGVCINEAVTDDDKADIEIMLNAIGQTMFIQEAMFDEFTAYSCAGPAYIMHILNSFIDAGVQTGFSRDDARAITLANFAGSAKMLELTNKHPYQIIDAMTSPAGVTIEGIRVLNDSKVQGVIMNCICEAIKRTREFK